MELSELDRRIAGALMVAPRAPWRHIAQVLGQAERTVARRGAELLGTGVVTVAGILARPVPMLIGIRTAPGTTPVASRALAGRDETSFVYEVTGDYDLLTEVVLGFDEVTDELTEVLPGVPGVQQLVSSPVLHYYKSLREWQPGLISAEQARALRPRPYFDPDYFGQYDELSPRDQLVAEALHADGRATAESVGRRVGVSEVTARRRIAHLVNNGILHVRALVDPSLLGLNVQALLWIKAPPGRVEEIGKGLAALPVSRYVAMLAGEHQLLADLTLARLHDLYAFTSDGPWAAEASEISTSMVLRARKRGGRLTAH